MTEFPFQLLIKRNLPKEQTESLTCTALLRTVAGSRDVYDARWNSRAVIVKIFSHKIRAGRHLKKEWRGLNILRSRGLSCPEPLFVGQTETGQRSMVVEKIGDSSTILDAFNKTSEPAEKLDLLVPVCRELAKQHSKGVLQRDLHLGNFLLTAGKVFALDAGQMRFLRREAGRKNSISQVAMLARYLPDGETESAINLFEEYFKARQWRPGKLDNQFFQKQLIVQRRRSIRRGLKKCLRTAKRQLRIKTDGWVGVFDRGFCRNAKPVDFIEKVDALMDAGEILKDGRSSYVSRISWNGKDVVVKRYNHKGLTHSLRHTIKRSRARRGWLYGHQLLMLNIATPKPLAYIEQRKGPLVWRSYLVTEYTAGQKLYDFLRDDNISEKQRLEAIKQVTESLERLGRHRISHGDLKHTNILITDKGPVLTDLDGMKVHKWNRTYKLRQTKDIRHFAALLESGLQNK